MMFFDSLTHPTLTGKLNDSDTSFDTVKNEMLKNGFKYACAVGLPNTENYNHADFINECKKHKCFIPIAGFDPKKEHEEIEQEIKQISKLGFKGIKIHPRISNIDWSHKTLPQILKLSAECNLVVMFCTYIDLKLSSLDTALSQLTKLIKDSKETNVILLHGGNVKLLEYAELAKVMPNVLLDLSFTILKYRGSSLDLDVNYLLNNLDQKICIGTDHPWYKHDELHRYLTHLLERLPKEKSENISYKNLAKMFGVKMQIDEVVLYG